MTMSITASSKRDKSCHPTVQHRKPCEGESAAVDELGFRVPWLILAYNVAGSFA